MPIDAMFGKTINLLAKSVELRAKNHNLISGNLANAETPGYVPFGLSFEKELKQAADGKKVGGVSNTHPRHIPLKGQAADLNDVKGQVVATPASSIGEDGNMVEVEGEVSRMTQNQLMFNATIQILGKKFEGIKTAIKGGV